MAVDRNGHKIHTGDIVSIHCVVTGVDEHPDHINLALETVEGRMPDGKKAEFFLNSNTVEVILVGGKSLTDSSVQNAMSESDAHNLPELKKGN